MRRKKEKGRSARSKKGSCNQVIQKFLCLYTGMAGKTEWGEEDGRRKEQDILGPERGTARMQLEDWAGGGCGGVCVWVVGFRRLLVWGRLCGGCWGVGWCGVGLACVVCWCC